MYQCIFILLYFSFVRVIIDEYIEAVCIDVTM